MAANTQKPTTPNYCSTNHRKVNGFNISMWKMYERQNADFYIEWSAKATEADRQTAPRVVSHSPY